MLKVVVAGFGFMGMTHTGNVLKNSAIKLAGIADKQGADIVEKLKVRSGNFATGGLQAEDLAGVNHYNDLADALRNEKPDACIIAVHTHLHYELARLALEAGVHVFLEKPFTLDVDKGQELIDLAREKNKVLMIGHVVRFMPAYITLKSWIDSRTYGRLEFLSMSRFSGVPSWGQWKEKQSKDFGISGGALFDLTIHDIDFAQWACGKPSRIQAQCLPGKLSNQDYVSALWGYEDNLVVRIEGGNAFHADYPFQASFHARFHSASVHYSTGKPEHIVVASDAGLDEIAVADANDGFARELDYFFECVSTGSRPLLCSPESALDSIKIGYRHIKPE